MNAIQTLEQWETDDEALGDPASIPVQEACTKDHLERRLEEVLQPIYADIADIRHALRLAEAEGTDVQRKVDALVRTKLHTVKERLLYQAFLKV